MSCCIFQFLTGCRCCNRICCQRRQRPVCNLGSLNFIPSVSRPTATQELRSVQANLSTGAGVVLSPGETHRLRLVNRQSEQKCLLRLHYGRACDKLNGQFSCKLVGRHRKRRRRHAVRVCVSERRQHSHLLSAVLLGTAKRLGGRYGCIRARKNKACQHKSFQCYAFKRHGSGGLGVDSDLLNEKSRV